MLPVLAWAAVGVVKAHLYVPDRSCRVTHQSIVAGRGVFQPVSASSQRSQELNACVAGTVVRAEWSSIRWDVQAWTPPTGRHSDGLWGWVDQLGLGESHRPGSGRPVSPTTLTMKPDGMADQDLSCGIDRHPRQVEGPSR
jgi:hypothetical protein